MLLIGQPPHTDGKIPFEDLIIEGRAGGPGLLRMEGPFTKSELALGRGAVAMLTRAIGTFVAWGGVLLQDGHLCHLIGEDTWCSGRCRAVPVLGSSGSRCLPHICVGPPVGHKQLLH